MATIMALYLFSIHFTFPCLARPPSSSTVMTQHGDFDLEAPSSTNLPSRHDRRSHENATPMEGTKASSVNSDEVTVGHKQGEEAKSADNTRKLLQPPNVRRGTFGQGGVKDRMRASFYRSWWLPEILAQASGILCLLGKLGSFVFAPSLPPSR